MAYRSRSEFAAQLRAEGFAQGFAEGEARAVRRGVLRVLDLRGIRVPSSVRDQVLACTDIEVLYDWVGRAATITSVEELFDCWRY